MTKSNYLMSHEEEKKLYRIRVNDIWGLKEFGRKVVRISPYQFRIDDVMDLYPTSGRFHNIKTGERGFYPAYIHADLMELDCEWKKSPGRPPEYF